MLKKSSCVLPSCVIIMRPLFVRLLSLRRYVSSIYMYITLLHIPQSSSVTGTSLSDHLLSYPGHFLGSYPFAEIQSVYSSAQADWAIMTMHKALHPRDDVDRFYVLRKEEDLPTFKIASVHWFDNLKTSSKQRLTVIWLHVFLSNTNNLPTVVSFQVFPSINF